MNKIIEKAVLVYLSISQYNPVRADRKITNEVLKERSAGHASGKWVKNLIDPEAIRSIVNAATDARQEHYRLTLPWEDGGWRILPTELFMTYQESIREKKVVFQSEVDKFAGAWAQHIENARIALNGMFDATQYPTEQVVRSEFGMRIEFHPIPSGSDFRISLAESEMDEIRSAFEQRIAETEKAAAKHLTQKLAEPVRAMADKLSDPKAIFRGTLVRNVRDVAELIPALNISGNKDLNQIAADILETLGNESPEKLRKDLKLRAEKAFAANEFLKKLEAIS